MTAHFPELLAPVGNMDMCQAAVHNGADAIYVGFPGFNARGRTLDHSFEALEEIISFCHSRNVKVFLALNILIYEKELLQLLSELPKALALNPDAFIIQDLGLARLIHFLCPTQVLHGSTQMTVTNHEHIALTADLNLKRYVLGREVSLMEMKIIRENTQKELEVFVHGALCVAYSGQCLTSEGFGGRSANRGQCAQSCRMEYDLIVDGQPRDLGELRYLVSPKDLCGLDDIPSLMEIGIDSFKIEGRLKTPQYVASTTLAYKQAMQPSLKIGNDGKESAFKSLLETRRELAITYSRGFFNGWMNGVDHQHLVDGRYGSHRGLELGRVKSINGNVLRISSAYPIRAGEGLLIVDYSTAGEKTNTPSNSWGARVYSTEKIDGISNPTSDWDLTFSNEFPLYQIPIGAIAYLNDSPALEREISNSFKDKSLWKTIPVSIKMEGTVEIPLSLTVSDGVFSVTSHSPTQLQPARNLTTALTAERAHAEAKSLSGSGFHLDKFEFSVADGLFLSDKDLRKTRQLAVADLVAKRSQMPKVAVRSLEDARAWIDKVVVTTPDSRATTNRGTSKAHLNLLIRENSSLAALELLPLKTVYLDFEHGKDYKTAVHQIRAMGFEAGIVTTRILKPSEYHNLKVIEALAPDTVLVRNLGALQYLSGKGLRLVGDFSLNVSNSLTASYLTGKGLKTLCPSYDLNQWQLFDLLDASPTTEFEITVHQYLPSFHMEHCVFAAFLSKGSSFRDCGKPCETHRVELRDHTGALHPLKADQECRNTMFNGKPQSAALLVPSLLAKGIGSFRVEALYEDAETLRAKVTEYARLVAGESSGQDVLPAWVWSRNMV